VADVPLRCTVRGCDEPLRRYDQAMRCTRGHSYDIARRGYVNLLQPQDRRSRRAGDSKRAVEARAELMRAGIGRGVVDAIVELVRRLPLPGSPPLVVDLGSGSGDTLSALADALTVAAVGIDLSVAAAEFSARRDPRLTWVVANADRRLPLADGSAALALSVHARRNPAECRRILDPRGFLLMAVPAPDDLVELREVVQGTALTRDRCEALVAEHATQFDVVSRTTVRGRATLDRAQLLLLLEGTYRGLRARQAERAQHIDRLDVTLASDLLLFTPR
jgi:23S rRNA (guanine745-N1)-methyltransferase